MKSVAPQVLNAVILQSFHPVLQNSEALLVNALVHFIKQSATLRNTTGFLGFEASTSPQSCVLIFSLLLADHFVKFFTNTLASISLAF